MSKVEFLEILKQSLDGEVSQQIIEQNIRYYDQYISGPEEQQQSILRELGEPRLIAKTIIETDKAARDKGRYSGYQNNEDNYNTYKTNTNEQGNTQRKRSVFFSGKAWYQKLALIIILILFILFTILIGRIIIGLLFTFGIPIILLLLVVYLFRK